MKTKITLLLSLVFLLAFVKDDLIEIESMLNARYTANFMANQKNVKAVLSKGTQGKVLETKLMPSGNFGVKINIESGAHKGDKVWVYYNLKNPALKLADKNKQVVTSVENATQAKVTREIASIKDPEIEFLKKPVTEIENINEGQLSQSLTPVKPPCKSSLVLSSNETLTNYDESMSVPPFKEINESPLHSSGCRANDLGYDVCRHSDTKIIEGFKLTNKGGNKIVTKNEYYINREFSFEFEDQARSDMRMMVADAPDDTTSHVNYAIMLFFPRTVLPSVKKVDNTLEVTLPNKEIIKYDANTKEIIGGVFTEGPMVQDERGKAKPANLKYTGAGVMIRADKTGDLPFGDIELRDGSKAPSISTSTISKSGFKDCKIPSKDLWYTDYVKGGTVYIKKEFANDQGLDTFIKSRCGFSLF